VSVVEGPGRPVAKLLHGPVIDVAFCSVYGALPPVQLIVTVLPLRVMDVILSGLRSVAGFEKFEVCVRPRVVPAGSCE